MENIIEYFDTVNVSALILPLGAQKILNNLANFLLNKSCRIEHETTDGT